MIISAHKHYVILQFSCNVQKTQLSSMQILKWAQSGIMENMEQV